DQLDPVHARHVDVGYDQIKATATEHVPTVHAVDGDLDPITLAVEKLALEFAHRQRIVDHENAFPLPRLARAFSLYLVKTIGLGEFFHRPDQVLDVDDENRRAILHKRRRADVLDLAKPRIER